MQGAKIHRNKKMSINEIVEFKKPKEVYIPLICGNDTDVTVIPKVGDYVYKGSVVGNNKGNFKMFIHSSVSGKVTAIESKNHPYGKQVKCLIVENDFKEQLKEIKGIKDNIHDYSKEEFIEIIKNAGIIGMGGAGFPTYVKYDTDKKIKTLVVNAVECEPYVSADYMMVKTKFKEILEAIDAIMEINKIDNCIIGVKKSNKVLVKLINQYIGTYLKIKLKTVPNRYPMGWERTLIQTTLGITYDRLPIEKGIVVNNVSTIYAIYEALKTGLPVLERIITISGEYTKKPTNISVKVGTPIHELLEQFELRNKRLVLIAGGPMMGDSLVNDEVMVTKELTALIALPPLKREETACLRCGKCIEVCPAGICPVIIKDCATNRKKLINLTPEKCISCGLCSYICPARIDVRKIVNDAKITAKGEE
jgi:electron transport complex, RnfABCDGE type, C subunit